MSRRKNTYTPGAAAVAAGLTAEAARRRAADLSFNSLTILGAYGDQKAGAEFGVAWANFLADLIPNEHRRPCINQFFGPNSESSSKKYLMPEAEDAQCLTPNLVIKIQQQAPTDYKAIPQWLSNLFEAGKVNISGQESRILDAMNRHLSAFNLQHQASYFSGSMGPSDDSSNVLAVLGGMGPIASAAFQKLVIDRADENDVSIWRFDLNLKPHDEIGLDPLVSENFSFWNFLKLLRGVSWIVNNTDAITALVAPSNTFNGVSVPRLTKIHAFSLLQNKFMNMLYVVANAVCASRDNPADKIGLLCTTPLKDSGLYQKIFRAHGVDLHCTTPDEQKNKIQKGIKLAKSGDRQSAEALFKAVIQDWASQGIKTIIFGCTEIYAAAAPVLTDFPGINFIDTNEVLATAAVHEMLQPGTVLKINDTAASYLTKFLDLLIRTLHCSRYWIKQNSLNSGSTMILPESIDAMIKVTTGQKPSDIELLTELVTIARTRLSQPIDASPQGLLKAAEKVFRHLPQTALFIGKSAASPMTQINKVSDALTNRKELYETVVLADTDLPQALERLQAYHRKIVLFDQLEKIPEFDFFSSQQTRALAAIALPEPSPPANLCKPFVATMRLEPSADAAEGDTTDAHASLSCG